MSTLHKVKAYFGMAPLEDYEDEYYDDDRSSRGGYGRRGDSYDRGERYEADYDHDSRDRRSTHRSATAAGTTRIRATVATSTTRPRLSGSPRCAAAARPAAPWPWTRAACSRCSTRASARPIAT